MLLTLPSDDSPPGYLHTKDVPSQVVTNPKDSSSDHVTLFSSDYASPEVTNPHILGSTDGLLAANDDSDQEVDGVASCARFYKVGYTTLNRLMTNPTSLPRNMAKW